MQCWRCARTCTCRWTVCRIPCHRHILVQSCYKTGLRFTKGTCSCIWHCMHVTTRSSNWNTCTRMPLDQILCLKSWNNSKKFSNRRMFLIIGIISFLLWIDGKSMYIVQVHVENWGKKYAIVSVWNVSTQKYFRKHAYSITWMLPLLWEKVPASPANFCKESCVGHLTRY